MKINSVNIVGFGGIKNKTINFNDGLNVIYGDNEKGKTTVMTFIKMMFYGNERGAASVAKNPRQKYTPWDGGIMAGSISFEHNGRNYLLEREFKKSNSTDKLTLCDLDLGTRETVSADIGEKFFGISSAAFERSVFIGQFGYPDNDAAAEGEINQKLSNIVNTGDESVSFDTVYSRLEKAKLNLMSKSGQKGEYDKNIKRLSSLKEELKKAESIHKKYDEFKTYADEIRTNVNMEIEEANNLKKKIDGELDLKNAQKLREMLELKEQLDKVNINLKTVDGQIIDETFLRKLQFCISKCNNIKQEIDIEERQKEIYNNGIEEYIKLQSDATPEAVEKLQKEIDGLQVEKDNLDKSLKIKEEEINSIPAENHKTANIITVSLMAVFAILAVLSFVKFFTVNAVLGSALGFSAIGLTILTFVLRFALNNGAKSKQKAININNEIADIKIKITEVIKDITILSSRLETMVTSLNSTTDLLEKQRNQLAQCVKKINELYAKLDAEKVILFNVYGNFATANSIDEISNNIEKIAKYTDEQKEIKQRLNYIARDVGNISYDEAKTKLDSLPESSDNLDFDELKSNYECLLSSITDKKTKLAAEAAAIRAEIENAKNPEILKQEIEALTKKTEEEAEFCSTLDIALTTLTESFAELRRSYGSVLEKSTGEIFAGLTEGKYNGMMISKSLDISVEKSDVFGSKELAYLSSGTVDQAYFSLRLALSKLISETGESLPLLLDDSFAQYDDTRLKKALNFLYDYSKNNQIIMFTCHSSVCDMVKSLGSKCTEL